VAALLRGTGRPASEHSHEIAHRLGPLARRLVKLWIAGRAVLRRPHRALALAIAVARTRQNRPLEGVVKTLDLIFVCGLIADLARRPGIHILDQGFFTGLWSIDFGAATHDRIGPILKVGAALCGRPPADLVLVLDVAPATAVDRLRGRSGGASRLERNLSGVGFDRDLEAAVTALRRVRSVIDSRPVSWQVRVVPDDPVRVADALTTFTTDSGL
jgi:hypothetical protein